MGQTDGQKHRQTYMLMLPFKNYNKNHYLLLFARNIKTGYLNKKSIQLNIKTMMLRSYWRRHFFRCDC